MNGTQKVAQQFIDSIELRGSANIPAEYVGAILTSFPIIGGGMDCVVINAADMIVRLVQRDGAWIAEHLVVRGR